MWQSKPTLRTLIADVIDRAVDLGVAKSDAINAKDYLQQCEWELAADTVIVQLYENNIAIDLSFYTLIELVAGRLQWKPNKYLFLKELLPQD